MHMILGVCGETLGEALVDQHCEQSYRNIAYSAFN